LIEIKRFIEKIIYNWLKVLATAHAFSQILRIFNGIIFIRKRRRVI